MDDEGAQLQERRSLIVNGPVRLPRFTGLKHPQESVSTEVWGTSWRESDRPIDEEAHESKRITKAELERMRMEKRNRVQQKSEQVPVQTPAEFSQWETASIKKAAVALLILAAVVAFFKWKKSP